VLNISSWGGGASPWPSGTKSGKFIEPAIGDGKVEVFGITGMLHMSQIAGKVRDGNRIGR
jgi:hypothetical protein